jgi:hypothetical protein
MQKVKAFNLNWYPARFFELLLVKKEVGSHVSAWIEPIKITYL